jgi:hypothetical protein
MDAALDAFGGLVDYEVGEVTAAATFYMAEIYSDFSRALIDSERPSDLEPSEMQSYEEALEEEAFPFEEKAIEVHRKNLELLASGVYSPWIEKSLGRLAELMPGRYAKFEASSGLLVSIDRYAYQAPHAPDAAAGETKIVETAPSAPVAPALATESIEAAGPGAPASQSESGSDAQPSSETQPEGHSEGPAAIGEASDAIAQ